MLNDVFPTNAHVDNGYLHVWISMNQLYVMNQNETNMDFLHFLKS